MARTLTIHCWTLFGRRPRQTTTRQAASDKDCVMWPGKRQVPRCTDARPPRAAVRLSFLCGFIDATARLALSTVNLGPCLVRVCRKGLTKFS